jgi:hypothetical protein
MKKYFRLSALVTVLGALIVGALGSGLWELMFKPLLVWISSFFLNVATLGINSLRDDLYIEIAKGLYDRSGLYGAGIVTVLMATLLSIPPIGLVILLPIFTRRRLRRFNLIEAATIADGPPFGGLRRIFRQIRWLTIFVSALVGIEVGVLLVALARQTFITNGAIYLDQTQRIISPFISPEERIIFGSRAAQMKSKGDFEILDSEFRRIAQVNNVALPKFSAF